MPFVYTWSEGMVYWEKIADVKSKCIWSDAFSVSNDRNRECLCLFLASPIKSINQQVPSEACHLFTKPTWPGSMRIGGASKKHFTSFCIHFDIWGNCSIVPWSRWIVTWLWNSSYVLLFLAAFLLGMNLFLQHSWIQLSNVWLKLLH